LNLTPNFTLTEMTATNTGINNEPTVVEAQKLLYLAQYILQPIRDKWGPVIVTSGYRSFDVNKAVGGSETSQHMGGEAADIVPVKAIMEDVFVWMVDNLTFGQAIFEQKGGDWWIHASLPRLGGQNQESLIYNGTDYMPYLQDG